MKKFSNIVSILLFGWLYLVAFPSASQEVRYFEHVYQVDSVLFSATPAGWLEGFYFPEYDGYHPLTRSFLIQSVTKDNNYKRNEVFSEVFSEGIALSKKSVILLRSKVAGIAGYSLHLLINGLNYDIEMPVAYDGYQVPAEFYLEDELDLDFSKEQLLQEIVIRVDNKDAEFEFLIGDLKVMEVSRTQRNITHPFFCGLSAFPCDGDQREFPPLWDYRSPHQYTASDHEKFAFLSAEILVVNETHAFPGLIRKLVDTYPFYEERSLDHSKIARDVDSLLSISEEGMAFVDNANRVSTYLDDIFDDGHFKIKIPGQPRKTLGPVRYYELSDGLYVSAVFNPQYQDIPVGAKVVSLDGVNVNDNWREKVSKLRSDSLKLGYVNENGMTEEAIIHYNSKLKVPQNFRPRHCEFKMLPDQTAYFRINRWTLDVYIRFLNHLPQLAEARSLIIDIRGNPGGSGQSPRQLFSLMIEEKTLYAKSLRKGVNQVENQEYIMPNPFVSLPATLRIGVLVDERTSCASEGFALAVQNLENGYVFGSQTRGVFANRIDFVFKSGIRLYSNSILPVPTDHDGNSIETIGVKPDYPLKPHTIEGLYPYEDEVLKAVLGQINNMNSIVKNN